MGRPVARAILVNWPLCVVVNRLNSLFPDTLYEVIYEPWAFTCVQDGQINLEPDEESYRAAMDALNGIDPTNGCLFYYNPKPQRPDGCSNGLPIIPKP